MYVCSFTPFASVPCCETLCAAFSHTFPHTDRRLLQIQHILTRPGMDEAWKRMCNRDSARIVKTMFHTHLKSFLPHIRIHSLSHTWMAEQAPACEADRAEAADSHMKLWGEGGREGGGERVDAGRGGEYRGIEKGQWWGFRALWGLLLEKNEGDLET